MNPKGKSLLGKKDAFFVAVIGGLGSEPNWEIISFRVVRACVWCGCVVKTGSQDDDAAAFDYPFPRCELSFEIIL